MKRSFLIVVVAAFVLPVVGQAQERLNCEDYLALDAEAKLVAFDVVKTELADSGQSWRFDAGESGEAMIGVMDSECKNPDGSPMTDLFDMMGK